MKRTVALIILDGWGVGPQNESNAIYVAKTPALDGIASEYPHTSLQASGISVGLPWGETGHSQVGHLTIGAGKTIYQYYPKITMSVRDQTFFENETLLKMVERVKERPNSAFHLVGLLSQGNTHSSLEHLEALIQMAEQNGIQNIWLHLITDGVDSTPKTLQSLLEKIPQDKIASLIGRYYAMDKNETWSLTSRAYLCLVGKDGAETQDLSKTLGAYFSRNASEEFLPPLRLKPEGNIKDGDTVFFFNFRQDGIYQLAKSFIDPSFSFFPRENFKDLECATLTKYSDNLACPVAFFSDRVTDPLGKVLSENGLTQMRISETNKYAHMTYFFNGHQEEPFQNEYRAFIPSLNLVHQDERPELVASAITDRLVEAIQSGAFDFVFANYSNADIMAHEGNYNACLEAVKILDNEIGKIIEMSKDTDTVVLITSDHGNAEEIIDPSTGIISTQHSKNPVPLYIWGKEFRGKKFFEQGYHGVETGGLLSDVAPTILEILGLEKPKDMNGQSLLRNLRG